MKVELSTGHGSHDAERLGPGGDRLGQLGILRRKGQILLAREEPHKGTALAGGVVAYGPPQLGMASLERVQEAPRRNGALEIELHFTVDPGEGPEVSGEHDADHGSVCASTESTLGRSRTIADQLSPASADA